jgi:tight adherence protein C
MINLATARIAFIVAIALALFFASYAVASAPTRIASRLGMRGFVRRKMIESNPLWAQLEPVVRWLGVRVSGVVSETQRNSLDEQIDLAGSYLGLTAEEFVGLSILSAILGGLFGIVFGNEAGNVGLFLVIGAALGAILPYMHITGTADKRLRDIQDGLPYAIDLMALAMSAGLDLPGAIRQVVEKSSNPEDPLIVEFQRMLQELQLGRTRNQALTDFALRAPTSQVNEFVGSLIQAEHRGNPVADVLQIQAGVARMRRTTRTEEAAAKAAVKMVGPLFLLFGCIMLLVMGPMILSLMSAVQ